MPTIQDRIKQIRKKVGLNQKDFASNLNISGGQQGCIETGARNATDRYISDVCRVYGIDENWLRTGEGEMINLSNVDSDFAQFVASMDICEDKEKEEMIKQIILIMSELSDSDVELVMSVIRRFAEKNK